MRIFFPGKFSPIVILGIGLLAFSGDIYEINANQIAGNSYQPKIDEPSSSETITKENTSSTYKDTRLEQLYKNIMEQATLTDGTVGVGIIHLESGKEIYFNRFEHFPMASAVKLPVAVKLMSLIDCGKLSLDTKIQIKKSDFCPGSGHIKYNYQPGDYLTVEYLITQMLTVSDNTATDIILRTIGGPASVDRQICDIGITGMSVDRPIFLVLANCWGINSLSGDEPTCEDEIAKLRAQISKQERIKARKEFINDTRDTTTPEAMANLLKKIWLRDSISDSSANVLLKIMEKSKGEKRIKGLLPPGTKVYHKTGTILGGLSDVGIVELPGNAGHVVVVEFVKGGKKTIAADAVMAKIAKEAYDFFNQNAKLN